MTRDRTTGLPVRRWICCVSLSAVLGATLAACTSAHKPIPTNHAFVEDIIKPLAAQHAEERVTQARALLARVNLAKEQLAAGQAVAPETLVMLNGVAGLIAMHAGESKGTEVLLSFMDSKEKKAMGARKIAYQDALAWIDGRRVPLQQEMTRQLSEKAVQTEKGYLLCVDGVQRQYERGTAGRYVRTADKAGLC